MIYRWANLPYFTSYFLQPTLCIYNSRDKYVRPYDKSTFVQELENNLMHDLAFDLEFSELEQLADDTIQVNLISEKASSVHKWEDTSNHFYLDFRHLTIFFFHFRGECLFRPYRSTGDVTDTKVWFIR